MQAKHLFLALSAAALLAACGGSSESPSPPPPAPPPAPSTVTLSGRAADGPLQGAIACYDSNDNAVCDGGEPTSGASDANGSFTLEVPIAAAGRHRVIVQVPATAIDRDTGQAVGSAFTLVAPASGTAGAQAVFVSPLSSLVQLQIESAGQSREQALAFVQQQAGLAMSPLADFTAGGSGAAEAANAARLVLQAQLRQSAQLAGAVGQNDISGAPITQAQIDAAVRARLLAALPGIGVAAAETAGLSGAARETTLAAAAERVVGTLGLSPDQLKFDAGLARMPQSADSGGEAGAMFALQFGNAANWYFAATLQTAADNSQGSDGMLRYYVQRSRSAPYAYLPTQGVQESYASSSPAELHWSGSAWTNCPLGERNVNSPRDAQGRGSYTRCGALESGYTQRAPVDIAGQALAGFWTDRLLPEAARTNSPGNWQLAEPSRLGSGVFPAGAKLLFWRSVITASAPAYDSAAATVELPSAAAAQGGDARGAQPACLSDSSRTPAATLEQLVERFPGRPCILNPVLDANHPSVDPNEAWGNSSVSLGTLRSDAARPAGTGMHYTTTRLLRAAFTGSDSGVRFLSCLQRTQNLSLRNCTLIGTGRYRITSLGDARVMRFENLPVDAYPMVGSPRVFVERGGKVYYGYQARVGSENSSLRLNLPAANALLRALELPPLQPTDAPKALSGGKATAQALLKGVWVMDDANGAALLRIGDQGQYLLAQATPADAAGRPGVELGWLDLDPANGRLSALVDVDSNGQWGLSHPRPDDGAVTVGDNELRIGSDVLPRFSDDASGLVGLWALGSASELKATQFLFLANGKLLSVHPAESEGPCAAARLGPPGVEWSDYSFDATTGRLRIFNRQIDSSGCTGVFDATDNPPAAEVLLSIEFSSDRQRFSGVGEGVTMHRVPPRP